MSNRVFNRYRELALKSEVSLGTKESLEWFKKRIRKDSSLQFDSVSSGLRRETLRPGKMVTYQYNPKHEKKLKYYDSNPLIIVLDITKTGWFGANLHYLPPTLRAGLLAELNYNNKTLRQIANALERNPATAVCLKRYLGNQVRSTPVTIPVNEWEIAIQLPFEKFAKATQQQVWRNSKRGIS